MTIQAATRVGNDYLQAFDSCSTHLASPLQIGRHKLYNGNCWEAEVPGSTFSSYTLSALTRKWGPFAWRSTRLNSKLQIFVNNKYFYTTCKSRRSIELWRFSKLNSLVNTTRLSSKLCTWTLCCCLEGFYNILFFSVVCKVLNKWNITILQFV